MQDSSVDKKWFAAALQKRGFASQKAFAKAVDLDGPKLTNLLNGKRRPQLEELLAMSTALNTPMWNLVQCFAVKNIKVTPPGLRIHAGVFDDDSIEFHDSLPDEDENIAEMPVGDYSGVGIRIRTPTLTPRYFEGEVLAARISPEKPPSDVTHLLGREVFVRQYDSEIRLKILHKGSRPGLYNLCSLNVRMAPIMDAEVEWAVPVDFHIPGWIRSKYRS
jgi:transcriptional regulator with XRE-family HTH domain